MDDNDVANDNDSLFSQKTVEKTQKTITPEQQFEQTIIEYSDEDLESMVQFVKNMTTLYDLKPDDWTVANDEIIKIFIVDVREVTLFVYFMGNTLTCSLSIPPTPVIDLTYFLRKSLDILHVSTFHDQISFGTIDDNLEGTILKMLEVVYAPPIFRVDTWPDSVKNNICHVIHMCLSKLTDLHYKLYGLTVLYIPSEGVDIDIDTASTDKEFVKRLEAVVVYWTKQIRVCLQDQDQTTPEDLLTPIDEYEFWIYRYENLQSLQYQLQNKNLNHYCEILVAAQSAYIQQFLQLVDEIMRYIMECKSNIEYLSLLLPHCKDLSEIVNPVDIPGKLPKILHTIRYIWVNSPFYNTPDKMVLICRALSNQLIIQCGRYINLNYVFKEREAQKSIKQFMDCIDCLNGYIKIYVLISSTHNRNSLKPWLLDRAPIFNHIDTFIERCKNMIEICDAMITYGRYDELEPIPRPNFGTSLRHELNRQYQRVEVMFEKCLKNLEKKRDIIFDINVSSWYDCILKFRMDIKNIDTVIENLINALFDEIANVEEGLEHLAAINNWARSPTLRQLIEEKTQQVYGLFGREVQQTKDDMGLGAQYHARLPFYAGRAMLAEQKKHRLIQLKALFDAAVSWLLPCGLAVEVFAQYDRLIQSMDERMLSLYRRWIVSLGDDFQSKLARSLMARSTINPGLLECNIDRDVLKFFEEAKYWDQLNFEIPGHVKSIYIKEDSIRFVYECVLSVVMDYNKIITSLSDEERALFKPLITVAEKKIIPGILKLKWSSDIGDDYISECSQSTAELQQFLDDYKSCNLQIVAICEKICDMSIVTFPTNRLYNLHEMSGDIMSQLDIVVDNLSQHYHNIIEFLIVVFEGFETYIPLIANQWIDYINNFDKLMEEALKICWKNSLQSIYERLHGDTIVGPSPLLKLSVSLKHNKIAFAPNLKDIEKLIYNIFPNMIAALEDVPRLNDKFHVAATNFPAYYEIIQSHPDCQAYQLLIDGEIEKNLQMIEDYMRCWEPYRDLWEIDKQLFMRKYELANHSAAQFDANINRYTEVANNAQFQEAIIDVHFININCGQLKKAIIEHCVNWQSELCQLLKNMTNKKINEIYNYIRINSEKVMKTPENLKEMENAISFHARLISEIAIQENLFPTITDQMLVLDKYDVEIDPDMRVLEKKLPTEWENYLEILAEAEKMLSYTKDSFKTQLLESAEILKKDGRELLENFLNLAPFGAEWNTQDALEYLKGVQIQLEMLKNIQNQLKNDLAIFELTLTECHELAALEEELSSLMLVWQLTEKWDQAWESYKSGEFWSIETEEMEVTAQSLFRKLTRLSRELKDKNWTIVEETRKRVDAFRRTLPLIGDLKNTAMRARHWDRVRKAIGQDFDENAPEFNLEAIYAMRMHEFAEDIADISNAATMELHIENGLKIIADKWQTITMEMEIFKDVYKIKNVDDCFQTLEENMVQLSAMKSTRFVEPFIRDVDYWERTLSYISETIELALTVQRQWLYLKNIFFGEDIRKQLPTETEEFDRLTYDWRVITYQMFISGVVLKAILYETPPYLLNKLNLMNEKLEHIQRALERYLETKRHIFPRFYFISNDDMLEILGNAKAPEAIQPHLKKLFDNLTKLKLQKNTITGKPEAIGMFSEDGEYIDFVKPIIIDGPVEMWLSDTEIAMRAALRKEIKPCRMQLKKMLNIRDKWLLNNFGQLCNACSQIQWTTDCTRALVHCKMLESKKPLKKLKKKQNQVLAKLSELSRRDLSKLQRLKTNALITIEIHSRDVIERMYKANCRDTNSFEWLAQLRFYWDRDVDSCVIKQTNTQFAYGYEYNGNSGRLVITPLTDRCYITLTTALHLYRGGSPKGPAGTGKTETVKDLGKAMGMWVIVNNCSEGLDYKSMGKCFSGLSQTGAWGCFDEFNRINIEVLSVVAQQILCILSAISQKKGRFVFEGAEINLKLTCGIFITMNPGYAGRTELPDNLKSMFRPISMMVPDSCIIAENLLFSDGFYNTKLLAKKVYTMYQLAQQQLSKQDHYDFGLRSMVALLRYSGRKRRQLGHLPEEQIVYLSMCDMNVARLTSNDLPLFLGIMTDIFPGVSIPTIDYIDLNMAMTEYMKEHTLQPITKALTKVIQLYETKNSRHSVMILGATGTAKSTTWQTLQGAMEKLCKLSRPGFNVVQIFPLNPKALNLGELYGEYNLSTNEWLDGVISSIMRITCADESSDEKWILFDGPVDAVWIENMNSVMDDNKVLTLINSDRITMPAQVSLLFEVGDLAVASPATVSRCGMVYNDYKDWGWQPYVMSWIEKQKKSGKLYQDTMMEHFKYYLPLVLEFKKFNCKETVVTAELSLVKSLCNLLEIFANVSNGVNPNDENSFDDMTKYWFLFCLIWSVCCTTDDDGRRKFDSFIREKEGCFPIKDTVYEYFIDTENKCFISWDNRLPFDWHYDPGWPFYKIIVPTVDTLRYKFVVIELISRNYPVLLTGPVGTGKTSTAQSVLIDFDPIRFALLNINMSAQTSSENLQDAIESRVEKRTKSVYVPPGGKTMITFLDDLNMPMKETYGSQPPLELLRQWIDYGFWYDRQKQTRRYIQNMHVIAAMGPPGGGRMVISERLLSKFNLINMTFPNKQNILRIYGLMLGQHLINFDESVRNVGRLIPESTLDLYNNVTTKMLPTPTKMHYLFNLRDISKIFQGLLRSHKDYQNDRQAFLRLWVHENFRVFSDRLTDDHDREWFVNQLNDLLGKYYETTFHNVCPNKIVPIFADFINPYSIYEDILDMQILRKYLLLQMEEYNASPGVVRIDLVLFQDVLEHICRIVRVVSQPRGNMLLVGIGGSGRQSVARIAAYLCEYNTYQITITKNYKTPEFREDLKTLYNMAGVDGKMTSFLFNDTQVTDENFLEIINNILSSGEVSNLYKPDEFEDVKNKLQPHAVKAGVVQTSEELYAFLIQRIRSNLHIILCMNPIGEAFRNRLRQYPALINCTTIDWFHEWPKEALLEVAHKYISDINFVLTITGETLERRRESVLISSQDKLKDAIALTFAVIHDSVAKYAYRMAMEMKRRTYITPTNYLELVSGYKKLLAEKRDYLSSYANKLRSGLNKIDDCKAKIEIMSVELEEAQLKVAEFQLQLDECMVVIMDQKKEADLQAKEVAKKSVKIKEEEIQCQKLADAAQADLDEAMPALEAAIAALDSLSKKDIGEMKSYTKPPAKVELVMEAVMILKRLEPTWTEAKKQLGDLNFLKDLKEFDKNHITDKTLKKINEYTTNPEFVPEKIGIVSFAAKSLCMWVIAIEKYAKVWKVVAPKKEKFDEAMESLQAKQRMLAEAQAKLRELNQMLQRLQKDYQEKCLQKEELNRRAEMLKLKLERADMLVDCLAGERIRWDETVQTLDYKFQCLPGDCLLATGFVSYLGPFVSNYREELLDLWRNEVTNQEIPATKNFDSINFLSTPTMIREWNIQGLPADDFSTENGIIVTRGSRWPLVIDPQCQAQKWIKNMESTNNLQVIDLGMMDYMKIIEMAIQKGLPVLLQNIAESIDPGLNPVLSKAVIKSGGMNVIVLDEKMISYNFNFRFYITTKLTNPTYPPEISTKTTLVNFAVKQEGLEAQLLGIVVRKERAQLEEQKDKLVTTIARGKKTLEDLENDLLKLLNETRGSLLEDVELFNTLQTSKATSLAVQKSLEVSEVTEAQIDRTREGYRPCAERASILFFVLNDTGRIDAMYQFSLDSYIALFIKSIENSMKSTVLQDRINILNDYHTYAVYKNTCQTLFEQHKLLFSFHMCMKILENQGKIIQTEYQFLLKGGVVLDRENQIDNPCPWLSEEAWDNITELDKLGGFHGVTETFEQYTKDWHQWYTHTEPETLPLIGQWNDICNQFQKMLFVRSLRSDRMSFCISSFISNQLGPKFVEPIVLDIKTVYEQSTAKTPLIFILSAGVDPTSTLIQLAINCNMYEKFFSLSLGQGQAQIATKLIQTGIRDGHWVFLANCHLSLSWMPRLDKIIDTLQTVKVNEQFRLWLSSNPHPDFPISILQSGIKMTTEPPKGLKANLKRLYQSLTEEQFYLCQAKEKYKKLLFSLCFFHSILLERKKFLQLGWNVIYSFNNSDFEVSENLLRMYLDEYEQTPWDALKYLIADVNYGGHVTDDWDRRLLSTYINQYFCDDALNVPYYKLSSLSTYYIPRDGSLQSYSNYITLLPNMDRPEAFGQHPNADITSLISETKVMCGVLMSLEIQSGSSDGDAKEENVSQLATDVLNKIPNLIDYENTDKLIGDVKTPLDVVLLQEISRYNYLLRSMKSSLDELQKAIKGFVVMSPDLEDIFNCIFEARVPGKWLRAYPSLKTLGSWTRDLVARVEHFAVWAQTTHPPLIFWLAAYTFPQAFLTAVLQTTARANGIPIDTLGWEFAVFPGDETQIIEPPATGGVYVRQVFLEGAGWDRRNGYLVEPQPMQLVCTMPVIHFRPTEIAKRPRGLYTCPCYYFPIRAGAPFRPAYVIAVDLKSGKEQPDFWIKRGTALLLSLAN